TRVCLSQVCDLLDVDAVVEAADIEKPRMRELGEPLRCFAQAAPFLGLNSVRNYGMRTGGSDSFQRRVGHGTYTSLFGTNLSERLLESGYEIGPLEVR